MDSPSPKKLTLKTLSLRYSSWSMRPWLALTQAGLEFSTDTVTLAHMMDPSTTTNLKERRRLGSVRGLFPVLQVAAVAPDDDTKKEEEEEEEETTTTWIHESLAICEYAADLCPEANLWPKSPTERARARALSCEMMTGFPSLRDECSCAMFARVPSFQSAPTTLKDIGRVFEIWSECLEHSGGPFLFGYHFGIVDCMYYPVITRFRTYGIELPTAQIKSYVEAVEKAPAVQKLVALARQEPTITIYDDYIRKLGGDPRGAML
mmetsp:Transcript_59794/g.146838  ORF Transcript_59794/g.146838 Transcript_59794/m.146838 type:complete len:263 (+) Transcript_59794:121-909(+)